MSAAYSWTMSWETKTLLVHGKTWRKLIQNVRGGHLKDSSHLLEVVADDEVEEVQLPVGLGQVGT